ncbi:MAG: tRNA adenosine(34) deaminase TadA [Gammaproteobacteria bacterium]
MGVTPDDLRFMEQALSQAREAEAAGEVPVGAVLVQDGEIIAQGHNASVCSHDPSAHAEIRVLREAGRRRTNYRLPGTTLYVTLEPCPMCAGALVQARVARLVYGAADPRAGAAGTVFDIVRSPALNHRLDVTSGVCGEAAAELLRGFFRARRD